MTNTVVDHFQDVLWTRVCSKKKKKGASGFIVDEPGSRSDISVMTQKWCAIAPNKNNSKSLMRSKNIIENQQFIQNIHINLASSPERKCCGCQDKLFVLKQGEVVTFDGLL